MLILGQKTYFLGPTIFKIPQPNWHYCTCHLKVSCLLIFSRVDYFMHTSYYILLLSRYSCQLRSKVITLEGLLARFDGECYLCHAILYYSEVPNRRAARNKRAGRHFFWKFINEQAGIKGAGWNFYWDLINEQGGNVKGGNYHYNWTGKEEWRTK